MRLIASFLVAAALSLRIRHGSSFSTVRLSSRGRTTAVGTVPSSPSLVPIVPVRGRRVPASLTFSRNTPMSVPLATTRTDHETPKSPNALDNIKASISQTAAMKAFQPYIRIESEADKKNVQLFTFFRVAIPAVVIGTLATLLFPGLALTLATLLNDAGVFAVLSQDSSQFVQNFLTVAGLLFSILVGQTYYFMYQQQESVYYALFNEVTEAKSLLEQVALVCQGRSMYRRCLESISRYVQEDLKRLQADPAVLLSARPVDDPLESIMYMTSVGVPSTVYETVRSLRQARAARLGALQRKLPAAHMWLLWILAAIELSSFPLLGAGTQAIGGYKILTVEGILFGVMTAGIVLTLRVVGELWRPAGGAYNVDAVLSVMVRGLEEELAGRMKGQRGYNTPGWSPSPVRGEMVDMPTSSSERDVLRKPFSSNGNSTSMDNTVLREQGPNLVVAGQRTWHFIRTLQSAWRRKD